jgi:hypothetical protein
VECEREAIESKEKTKRSTKSKASTDTNNIYNNYNIITK